MRVWDNNRWYLIGNFLFAWFSSPLLNSQRTRILKAIYVHIYCLNRVPHIHSYKYIVQCSRMFYISSKVDNNYYTGFFLKFTHLARARLGLLAAAGAGLAGLAGIAPNHNLGGNFSHNSTHCSNTVTVSTCGGQTSTLPTSVHRNSAGTTPGELDAIIRQVQKNGRCHIRTLSTLAAVNLICWVPLYICALVAPVGK